MTSTAPLGIHHLEQVMGTSVGIDIRDLGCAPKAIDAVIEWLHHVDDTFSTYKLESPISALGRGELAYDQASSEVRRVLRACEALRLETTGAFDAFCVPAPNGSQLDPSGFVKGWAIEGAASILEANGCANFCINAGGDVAVRGHPEPATPWRVGIRHPDDSAAFAAVIAAEGRLAIATSATYERGAHIIDPATGEPTTELASATIVGPDLGMADAYATAAFVKGLDTLEWLAGRDDYEAYLVTHDGTTFWTPGFNAFRDNLT